MKQTITKVQPPKAAAPQIEALRKNLIEEMARDVTRHVRKNLEAFLYHSFPQSLQDKILADYDLAATDVVRRIEGGFSVVIDENEK